MLLAAKMVWKNMVKLCVIQKTIEHCKMIKNMSISTAAQNTLKQINNETGKNRVNEENGDAVCRQLQCIPCNHIQVDRII